MRTQLQTPTLARLTISQSCAKMRKISRPWPKSNEFLSWSGYISMPNFRPFTTFHFSKIGRSFRDWLFWFRTCSMRSLENGRKSQIWPVSLSYLTDDLEEDTYFLPQGRMILSVNIMKLGRDMAPIIVTDRQTERRTVVFIELLARS